MNSTHTIIPLPFHTPRCEPVTRYYFIHRLIPIIPSTMSVYVLGHVYPPDSPSAYQNNNNNNKIAMHPPPPTSGLELHMALVHIVIFIFMAVDLIFA
jgi:hypothetical protein